MRTRPTARRRPSGPTARTTVHLVLRAKKLKGDSLGNTREVPMADYVDVGVFGERVAGQKLGEPLLVKKVHITQAVTTLDLSCRRSRRRRASTRTTS